MPMAADAEMEGAQPPMPAPGDHLAEPMQMVLGLLDKLGAMDPQRIFDAPVDGNVVRGYYDKIKQPMCFQWMREKVRTRQYRTWRSFVADFELMCNNARHFNPPQHKVNRLATGLMRSGKKLLQQHELLGRRCLYALHPEGPKAAAEEEEAQLLQSKEQQQHQQQQDPQQPRSSSHGAPTTTSMDADTHSGDLGYAGGDAGAVKEEPAEAASLPPPPPELLSTAAQLWDPNFMSISGGDWGLLFRAVPESTIDATTQHLKPPVVFAPYLPTPLALPPLRSTPGAGSSTPQQQQQHTRQQDGQQPQQQQESQQGPSSSHAAGPSQQQQQQQGAPQPSQQPEQQQGAPPAISNQDAAAADVLWRCHWLELRMRQLQHLLRLMDAAPPPAAPAPPPTPVPPAAAAAAAGADGAAPGAAGDGAAPDGTAAAAAAAAAGGAQQAAAAAGPEPGWEFPPGVPHVVSTAGGVLLPQHLQHADAAALPEHPFFVLQRGEQLTPAATPTTATAAAAAAAAAAGGQLPARGTHKQAAGSAAAAAGKAGPQEAGLEGLDAAAAAAAAAASVYTSLDLLELRLIQMRSKLAAAYGIEAGFAPEGIRIGAYAAAHLDTPRQRGPVARQGSMAGGGGGATGGGWASSARGLQREASGSIKRRRTMTGDDEAASGGARIDRQVSNIHIPQVRTLSNSELAARAAAIAALQALAGGPKRGRSLPPEVLALCDPDEGSSSEDTSDSAYAAMHAPLEEEEQIRLNGVPAGGQNKKDKSKSKNQGDKAGGSSKGPAGKGGRGGGGGGGGGGGSSSAARGRGGAPTLPRAGSLTPMGTAGPPAPGLLPTHTSAPAALITAAAGGRAGGAAAAGTAVGVVPGEVTSGVTPGELQQQQPHLAMAQQLLLRQQQPTQGGGSNGLLQANGEAPVTPVKRGPSGDPSDCLGEPSQSVGSGARRLAVTPLVSAQGGGDSPVPSGHMCLPAAAVQPCVGGANSMPVSATAAVPVLAGSGRLTEEPTPPPPKAPSHKAAPAKAAPQVAARAAGVSMGTRSMDASTRRGTSRSSGGGGGGSKGVTRSSSGKRG